MSASDDYRAELAINPHSPIRVPSAVAHQIAAAGDIEAFGRRYEVCTKDLGTGDYRVSVREAV